MLCSSLSIIPVDPQLGRSNILKSPLLETLDLRTGYRHPSLPVLRSIMLTHIIAYDDDLKVWGTSFEVRRLDTIGHWLTWGPEVVCNNVSDHKWVVRSQIEDPVIQSPSTRCSQFRAFTSVSLTLKPEECIPSLNPKLSPARYISWHHRTITSHPPAQSDHKPFSPPTDRIPPLPSILPLPIVSNCSLPKGLYPLRDRSLVLPYTIVSLCSSILYRRGVNVDMYTI